MDQAVRVHRVLVAVTDGLVTCGIGALALTFVLALVLALLLGGDQAVDEEYPVAPQFFAQVFPDAAISHQVSALRARGEQREVLQESLVVVLAAGSAGENGEAVEFAFEAGFGVLAREPQLRRGVWAGQGDDSAPHAANEAVDHRPKQRLIAIARACRAQGQPDKNLRLRDRPSHLLGEQRRDLRERLGPLQNGG